MMRELLPLSGQTRHPRVGGDPSKKGCFYVYIMTNQPGGTLYIGVTSDLPKRVWEHKAGQVDGFTKKYGLSTLVYYEVYEDAVTAIAREKAMKKWNREWKITRIAEANPLWEDLSLTFNA